jgi:adenylylsulfate kinase
MLTIGLPGADNTTLSTALSERLRAVHFNNDAIRAEINKGLGFSETDRVEQARRMGWLCYQVVRSGTPAIADFVCPTEATRAAFGEASVVWVNRIAESRFADTNRLFELPTRFDVRVTSEGTALAWAETMAEMIRPVFGPRKPTALFFGRYQPFHAGHKALIEEGVERVGQVCIAVRDTHGLDASNPLSFQDVRLRIEGAMAEHAGRFVVQPLPKITNVFYGRDFGYSIERIDLDADLRQLSAAKVRRETGIGLR